MRKVLLDTNVYCAFKKNNKKIVDAFKHLDYIGIDITMLAELYSGFKSGNKETINRNELECFLNSKRVHILNHNDITADFYAYIFDTLKKKGTPIPTNDIWIAAVALQNGLTLFTLDKHFQNIDGLLLKNNL